MFVASYLNQRHLHFLTCILFNPTRSRFRTLAVYLQKWTEACRAWLNAHGFTHESTTLKPKTKNNVYCACYHTLIMPSIAMYIHACLSTVYIYSTQRRRREGRIHAGSYRYHACVLLFLYIMFKAGTTSLRCLLARTLDCAFQPLKL